MRMYKDVEIYDGKYITLNDNGEWWLMTDQKIGQKYFTNKKNWIAQIPDYKT